MKSVFKGSGKMKAFDRASIAAVVICAAVFIVWQQLLLAKYLNFGYVDWDLAYFNQAMWNFVHGRQYSSLFDSNFFGNHANIIACLLAPFYKAAPGPLFLLGLKALAHACTGYFVFWFAREKLGTALGFVFLVLFFIYPPNVFGMLYEFDFENLAPLFLTLMFYFFYKGLWAPFMVSCALAIMIKENLPLVVFTFGVLGMLTKKEKMGWGIVPMVLGLGSFIYLSKVFVPLFRYGTAGDHPYIGLYAHLGTSLGEILVNVFKKPGTVLALFLNETRLEWLILNFGQFLFLPLLAVNIMWLIAPLMAQHFLSAAFQQHTIYFGYTLPLAPFIFFGAAQSLSWISGRFDRKKNLFLIGAVLLLSAGNFIGHRSAFIERYEGAHSSYPGLINPLKWQMINALGPQDKVISSFDFLAPLSNRENLYSFHKVFDVYYQNENHSYQFPEEVAAALIDFRDPALHGHMSANPAFVSKKVYEFLNSDDWSVTMAYEDVVLFKKEQNPQALKLVERVDLRQQEGSGGLFAVEDKFGLLDVRKGRPLNQHQPTLPLVFTWAGFEGDLGQYVLKLKVMKNGRELHQAVHRLGYEVYPTQVWQAGDRVREMMWLLAPVENLEGLSVAVSVYKSGPKGSFEKVPLRTGSGAAPQESFVFDYDKLKGLNDDR